MLPEEGATVEDRLDERIDEILAEKPEIEPVTDKAQEEEKPEEAPEVEAEPEKEEQDKEESKDTSDDKKDPEEEGETSELTLAQVAEVLGVEEDNLDVDDDGQVVMKTKIDGIEGKVSLAEARKSYQLEGHLNKQNMEVVEMRKALEAERNTFQQEQQSKSQRLEDTIQLAANELTREYQSVDWDQLKIVDPQQFLVLKDEYQQRQATINQGYNEILEKRNQLEQQFIADRDVKLSEETAKLRSLVPGWDTDDGYVEGAGEVKQTLLDHGFSEQDIEATSLAQSMPPEFATRLFVMANKVAAYDKLQLSQAETIKKIRKAPKVVSAGVAKEAATPKTVLKDALANVKKTGGSDSSIMDALAAKGLK